MNAGSLQYSPGALIRVRGREWVVLPKSTPDILRLRPLGGSEEDLVVLTPALEWQPPEPAVFPWPDPTQIGSHDSALLLREALRLKLRAGAGPFRSFGNIAVEPRAYQLVPLLMALRLPTVRLLIADDVGIGKTIEAGLIVRELFDRGEISRLAVLCPPHLVEQWRSELRERFHFHAEALTAATAARLERKLPHGVGLFDQHPFLVVSLDYIKSERHREHFLSMAPEFVIVDEAHSCTGAGRGKQLRFELLQRLAGDDKRHLLLLTATPHSGNDAAFNNLLSLLKPEFAGLAGAEEGPRKSLREDLARYFVQRRRKDIEEWQDQNLFPKRMTKEVTYSLSGRWGDFFEKVQDYCLDLAGRTEAQGGQGARLIWYVTLALLRCVSSSPQAAVRALTTRLEGFQPKENTEGDQATRIENLDQDDRLYDGEAEDWQGSDLEPSGQIEESDTLKGLIEEAKALSGLKGDPKLAVLTKHVSDLLDENYSPVIFCRYIATAHYVAKHLKENLKKVNVDAITGEYTPEEREIRVHALGEFERKILVATDCLSEGVNLQNLFDAVVHYDLAWNPTRHEQREGRVDRFGQRRSEVRATMIYGQDNPVDGFILQVILRKAESIRQELGVLVSMPEDNQRIQQALVKAALLKRKRNAQQQITLDFGDTLESLKPLESEWNDAMEKAKANRTVFAQRRIKPEEVLPEWKKQVGLLGGESDVARFVASASSRFNAPLEPFRNGAHKLLVNRLPADLTERLALHGIEKHWALDFRFPPISGTSFVHRSHPLVSVLADALLEGALSGDRPLAARCAVTVSNDVDKYTLLVVLRLRHQISMTRKNETRLLMAEETATLAVRGRSQPEWVIGEEALRYFDLTPSANIASETAAREINQALEILRAHTSKIETLARARAEELLVDHRRVREAARDQGSYAVQASLPVDIMGVYVLLPGVL